MVGWTVGILAALGLAWFVGGVGASVWRTRSLIQHLWSDQEITWKDSVYREETTRRLGQPEEAAGQLALYVYMPGWIAPKRHEAVWLLGMCGKPGIARIPGFLNHRDPSVRGSAAHALGQFGDASAVEPLIAALGDNNCSVRFAATQALGRLRSPWATEALKKALEDSNESVRSAAAEALKKIKGEETGK